MPLSSDTEAMISQLRQLCAFPSVSGEVAQLAAAAEGIAALLGQMGLAARVIPTSGAPAIVAERAGRSPTRVLLYDHYDVAPAGAWRAWHHDPFELSERDDVLYGRGVVSKGNLVARLAALASLLAAGELPVGVALLIEGEALAGSPALREVIAAAPEAVRADLVLGPHGELDPRGVPFIYAGAKGRLQLRVSVQGPPSALPPEVAASLANPAWRLLWALASIKSEAEEVLVDGFYDDVEPVSREVSRHIKQIRIDEAARLAGWAAQQFLVEMSGPTLVRAETINPTCNLALLSSGSGNLAALPSQASALIDFALVPNQRPTILLEQVRAHLVEREFADVQVEQMPGAFRPARTPMDDPRLATLVAAGQAVYGHTPQVMPLGPFTSPLHLFAAGMSVPALSLGLTRPDSAPRGPNEQVRLGDLRQMAELVATLLQRMGDAA